METLVKKLDDFCMSHFQRSVKDFIEHGVKKGRHYFYLRDALSLSDKKFKALLDHLGINKDKINSTKQNFYNLFVEAEALKDVMDEEEDFV